MDSSPKGIFNIMDEECLRPGEDNDEVSGCGFGRQASVGVAHGKRLYVVRSAGL